MKSRYDIKPKSKNIHTSRVVYAYTKSGRHSGPTGRRQYSTIIYVYLFDDLYIYYYCYRIFIRRKFTGPVVYGHVYMCVWVCVLGVIQYLYICYFYYLFLSNFENKSRTISQQRNIYFIPVRNAILYVYVIIIYLTNR